MGASESKLVFKQGIFRLSEDQSIPANDSYWTGFWELPESVEDVFSLFSTADIRRTRDASVQNLETLILAMTSRLNALKNHPAFPDPESAPERDALNCLRVLTRILPYVYEADNLTEWEDNFFWSVRRRRVRQGQLAGEILFDESQTEDDELLRGKEQEFEEVKPLGEELIDTLIDLLFFTGFTIPRLATAKSKVTYAIWQSGVGCKTSIGTNKDLESNRCEVLRLLLTMTSKSMYTPANVLPSRGIRALTYLTSCPDKQIVLSVLCSLLNTTIKYNATNWRLPYDHVVRKDPKQSLVVHCLQVLLVLLVYPIPDDGSGTSPKNYYRHYLGRLHRPEDFQFLADGMTRILGQPMQATSSYLPGSQRSLQWAPEVIMLFWETLQCNKRFRSFIIESNRAHDFVILMLFYAIEHKADASKQGIVRACVFVLQTMSVEVAFGKNLNKKFEAQETLPPSVRLSSFRGSYADFLIISIHTLITGSRGKLDAIYPALLAIINNIAPYVQGLSTVTCTKLLQLFASMSAPSFLLANESNHALLQSLLEAINTTIEHQYTTNANLIYAVLKSRKKVEALRVFTLEQGQEEIERMARRRKEILGSSSSEAVTSPSRNESMEQPSSTDHPPTPFSASQEDGPFTIGDSEDSDNEIEQPTPSQSSPSQRHSRTPSIASSVDETIPIQIRGMSEKARGKLPVGAQPFQRQNSTTSIASQTPSHSSTSNTNGNSFTPTVPWLESWLSELPLHTMLTLIRTLSPHLPNPSFSSINPSLTTFLSTTFPDSTTSPQISNLITSPTPILIHTFSWSPQALGWYLSLLWSFIYTSETTITATSSGTPGQGVGVWNGTNVRLFQVQEGKKEGPSLSRPRGAVDAVGSRLVDAVGGLGIGRLTSGGSTSSTSGSVREI